MNKKYLTLFVGSLIIALSSQVHAMHIAEGFLPPKWAIIYFVLSVPFIIVGLKQIRKNTAKNKDLKMLLAVVAAYSFILSAMKIPSVTGSCSHPTGTGLAAMIFGPFIASVVGLIVLIFQALLLAHGGITTLGANTFSMGIVGPIVSYLIFKVLKNKNKKVAVFLSACLGDLATYTITSLQLALSFPAKTGGVLASFTKFCTIFSVTQIPLAIVEGLITIMIFEFISKYSNEEIKTLSEV
ncbi:energy-coupling factor ABC transporter permease [Clostridium niameyense]|uniref:energy-coupling factor ABC transporter permease n=1 Tax=Clostridium niameyense TaxID=1622073 RepID=UPI0013D6155E|nr:energy-coupling factor ABC transporter permease [Clostridium niameyense]